MENLTYCTSCGKSLVTGSNLCESCGKLNVKPVTTNNNTTSNYSNINSTGSFTNFSVNQTNQYTTQNNPNARNNSIDFVQNKPKFFTFNEFKDILLAYTVIYIGFVSRRIVLSEKSLLVSIFETIALIVGIFGYWLIIDKIISYKHNLYPKFIFDPNKSLMAMFFAFIFIGFPPGYYKYRVWIQKFPQPNNIIKIQFLINLLLVLYGYMWFIAIINFPALFIGSVFLYFPFIISISVGFGILPIGTSSLMPKWNKYYYYFLVMITAALIVSSYGLAFY